MKNIKLGYYLNSIIKNNIENKNISSKKRKQLVQSISEGYIYNNNNQINFKNNDCKIKNIDIKFNIINNLKKYDNIFNKKTYKNLIKSYEDINQINSKYQIKNIDNNTIIPHLLIYNQNNLYDNIENNKTNNNKQKKQKQLDPHNYFPEDFSLNIYKSTSLYKNRYKIQTSRLKKTLKILYNEENSKKSKNIINIIKNNSIQNSLNAKMFKLLKSQKIDRFVNRLLNIRTISSKNGNENSLEKSNSKIQEKNIFITNKNKNIKKINFFDSDKKSNAYIYPYTNINNENFKTNDYNYIINRNFPIDISKINTANSATQTIDNKNNFCNTNEIVDKSLKDKNKRKIVNNKYINNRHSGKENYFNYKEIKFEMIKIPKKNIFSKKNKMIRRPFSASKTYSSFFNKNNNNINFNQDKQLIFSFYDPKDKYIQLFKEIEKNNKVKHKY